LTNAREFALNLRYAFRPHKPVLVARLVNAVLRARLSSRAPRLRYVDFAVDFLCNLKCAHCFATALEEKERRRMSAADYARVAREAMALGAVNFSFQGGEPLLFSGLSDLIQACRPERNVISVSTNGTMVTPERARALRKSGVDILTVSLDSAVPEEHDAFRGVSGAWKRTVAGIAAARGAGLHVTLASVVTHASLHSRGIADLIAFAREERLLLYILLPVPIGSWESNTGTLLDEDDLTYIRRLTLESPYIRTDFQANLGGYGCGAAKEILYLTPYGDVLVCPYIHVGFGNVFEDDLATIRARALSVPCFQTYHDKCLASTDADFLGPYLERAKGRQGPIPHGELFPPRGSTG
jgi:MoaA/NifB/PqqE/SkfB family radical SAM enzyme